MTAITASPRPTAAPLIREGRVGFATLGVLLILGFAYIASGVEATRASALLPVVSEFAVCVVLLGVAMARSPGGTLRVSDPFIPLLGFGFNFLVIPAVEWLHGADYERAWFELGRIRVDIFARLQWMHVVFLVGLSAAYFAVAPRRTTFSVAPSAPLPSAWPLILFGMIPLTYAVVERLITTGSIVASENYGTLWYRQQEQLSATYGEGGSTLAATQVLGKVWFLPWQALGIGEGLLLAKLIQERRRLAILLFALQVPIFTFLHAGSRSNIAIPFIGALLVADALAGPIRWRWVLTIAFVGLTFFNFFGIYRAYRDRDFNEAVAITSERYGGAPQAGGHSAEGDIMVVKEHYAIAWTEANSYSRGATYFSESLLSLLPQQVIPEKLGYMNTATFLSRELLGATASQGAGVAGSMIVDGIMIGAELGVLVLGLVLGLIAGVTTRSLTTSTAAHARRPRLWQVLLLLSIPSISIAYYRNDLAVVVSQTFSCVVLPALLFAMGVALAPRSAWGRRLEAS